MRKNYETPSVEVIAIEAQGVLCSSSPQPTTIPNPTGGTESINRNDFSF